MDVASGKPGGLDGGHAIREEDIGPVYSLFLGREADALARESFVGRTLEEAADRFIGSEEFRVYAEQAVARKTLSRHLGLEPARLQGAARWLGAEAGIVIPKKMLRWTFLVNALFETGFVQAALERHGESEYGEMLASLESGEAAVYRKVAGALQFDPAWFRRRNLAAGVPAEGGDVDAFLRLQGRRSALQVLPAFSDGIEAIVARARTGKELSVEGIAAETLEALRRGETGHWLFDPDFYFVHARGTEVETDDKERPLFTDHTSRYLDFLVEGDGRNCAPHPLFCHAAYRQLNPGRAVDPQRSLYLDYLTGGCFADARTTALFDADYYLRSNPSAVLEIGSGRYINALHHFVRVGIYQDLPFLPDFLLDHYRREHPDVVDAARSGVIPSVTWHFLFRGVPEGRAPNPFFSSSYYRDRQPGVAREMRELGILSELEHFILIGKARGYKTSQPIVEAVPDPRTGKAIFQRRARRAFNQVSREPLDFTPFRAGKAAVSLVVPVSNEVEFTCLLLQCAFFAFSHFRSRHEGGCELIVVDNGSTDLTRSVLALCKGLTHLTYDRQIGFPRAVNEGVGQSGGEVVIVANNDIAFMPDAVLKAYDRLRERPEIGILGGLVVLPNETLQEAGSFLDRSAGVVGLGREEDPWDAFFQGLHRTDYCSGCFLAFRRADYDAVGGFDEGYSPGYYEEVDFTFRVREQLGKTAAIDSGIEISHFEHASFSKGRPPTTAYALIMKNRGRFAQRHKEALDRLPSAQRLLTREGRARPEVLKRPRLLVIEDLMPDERLGSGFGRTRKVLKSLAESGVAFDILVLGSSAVVDEYEDPRVRIYRGWMSGSGPEDVLARHGSRYSHVMVCRTHNLRRFGSALQGLKEAHGTAIICDTEALTTLRVMETRRVGGVPVGDEEEATALRCELESAASVDLWIAVSPLEAEKMRGVGAGPVAIVGYHQSAGAPLAPLPLRERHRILFVGAVHGPEAPNYDGLVWFMDHCYGRHAETFGRFELTLAGYWEPRMRKDFESRFAGRDIRFLGSVSNREIASLYGQSRAALAPVRFAAGIAIKAVEAFYNRTPIVMTDLIERQILGSASGSAGLATALRTDGGRSFADRLHEICTDEARWQRVVTAQDAVLERCFGRAPFERAIEGLVSALRIA